MKDLLEQYKEARKGLIKMIEQLGDGEREKEDKKMLNSMKRDVEYIIKWLKLGYDPENPAGVNVEDAYNIERHENMDVFPDINEQLREEREKLREITSEERNTILKIFNSLSEREQECFLLRLRGYTYQEIADELDVSIWTARTYVARAEEKIERVRKDER